MRRFAFVVFVIGMFVLMGFLIFFVKEVDDLEGLEINERVIVGGMVMDERVIFGSEKLLILDNGIELVCECFGVFEGREILVEGVVMEFRGKKQVRVLSISVGD